MTDFDAVLKRSFAEFHEPEDNGFVVRVGEAVARSERRSRLYNAIQIGGVTLGAAAAAYGAYVVVGAFGQELMANAGLEIARAHSALSGAPSFTGQAQTLMQSLGAGLTQALLVVAALAGGAVAYRAAQD